MQKSKSFKMHIDSKNQNAKKRVETKNILYFHFPLKKSWKATSLDKTYVDFFTF